MAAPKGLLVVPIGFNPSGDVRAITLSADDYLHCVLEAGLTGGGMGTPEGKVVTICGFDPDGTLRAIELDANDNLLISLLGGAANQVIKSDGTDAEWDTLANVIEAAILTSNGDILIRNGSGNAVRLGIGAEEKTLRVVGGLPAWVEPYMSLKTLSDNTIENASGAYQTMCTMSVGFFGSVYCYATEAGYNHIGAYRIDYVGGASLDITVTTIGEVGGSQGHLTFQQDGFDIQARGANAVYPPAIVKYLVYRWVFELS